MNYITIIILALTFLFGVYEMNKVSSITKESWFKELSYNDKIKVTSKIKNNWKKSIILLAVIVAAILIVISSFIGKVHNHDNIVNITMIIIDVIVLCIIIYNNKVFSKNINNFNE